MTSAPRPGMVAAAWAAMAAYETQSSRLPGMDVFRCLQARGVTEAEIEAAADLHDLEQAVTVAGLQGRVEDLDAEVERAHAAAVVFAHATHPDVTTVEVARHVMTPTDWLIFESLTEGGDFDGVDGVGA